MSSSAHGQLPGGRCGKFPRRKITMKSCSRYCFFREGFSWRKHRSFRRDQRPTIRPCFMGHSRVFVHQQKSLERSVRCGDAHCYNNKKLGPTFSCVDGAIDASWISYANPGRQPVDCVCRNADTLCGSGRSAKPPTPERNDSASPPVPGAQWDRPISRIWRRFLPQQSRHELGNHCRDPIDLFPAPSDVVVELCICDRVFARVLRRSLSERRSRRIRHWRPLGVACAERCAASMAATPDRAAPSSVAGKFVCAQSPARKRLRT